MKQLNQICRGVFPAFGVLTMVILLMGADDEPKQTIDAKGMTFEAPKTWKSSKPSSEMRRAELKVEPIEGDDYAAEVVVTAFRGSAGTVEANLKRWQNFFKDEDGKTPEIESKKVQAKNTEVTRAETSGHYYPAALPGRPKEPDRAGARFLGAIVTGEKYSYYIRMVGPDKTMKKLTKDFDEMLKTIKLEED
jgi:hypothetical protein